MDEKIILAATFSVVVTTTTVLYAETLSGTDFDRWNPTDVRVLSYNLHGDLDPQSLSENGFSRVVSAIDPDIVVFQEVSGSYSDAEEFSNWLDHQLPQNSWQVQVGISAGVRTIVGSHYPMSMQEQDTIPASSTRGVTMCLVDLPDNVFDVDAYILGVHFKCCDYPGDNEKRQKSADAIVTWMGDAKYQGRYIDLPWGTPMLVVGDMNLVGGPQPETTLLTGDVIEEEVYCQDSKSDWDHSDMFDVAPVDPNTGDDYTWQGNDWYDPSRLDRFMVTDSVMQLANSFVLNTGTMSNDALNALQLNESDTSPAVTSDHLPVVVDFRPTQQATSCASDLDGDGIVNVSDLLRTIDSWAPNGGCCPGCPGDVTGDLAVDVSDVLEVVGHWGPCQ
ncbi:MAG: hypothetical protein QGI78_09210 [Phycisphaerales bacterium]|nr:hypothetical protein [Phycisphaerales bacterium]